MLKNRLKKRIIETGITILSLVFILAPFSSASMIPADGIALVKSRLMYNLVLKSSFLYVAVENTSAKNIAAPVMVVVENISNEEISVSNPDGVTDDGKPFFLYHSETPDNQLAPGTSSSNKTWYFLNPNGYRFSYDVKIYAGSIEFTTDHDVIEFGSSATLSWSTTNADTCIIEPDIGTADLNGSIQVSPSVTTTYTLTATGPGGSATSSVTINVNAPTNTHTPPSANLTASSASIEQGGTITLSWDSEGAESAFIDSGIGVVPVNGSTTVSPDHSTTYTLTVTGSAGSVSSQATIMVTGSPSSPPVGSFGERYNDLVPMDATILEYDEKRFSIITGLVNGIDESLINDVSISIHSHPEYGTTFTDAGGRFSIPVEGGGNLIVIYRKEGLISSQRQVYVPWNDIAVTETVRMIAEDPKSTTLVFDGNPETVVTHRSTEVVDSSGARSCTMVFKGDNRAYLIDKEGNDVHPLTTITTRATEYTAPETMPAVLPPNSAFTYCAELRVDGIERVRFEKPVVTWVNNFHGFDVGGAVPVGYFDRDRGVWVPADNGVVVMLLDTDSDGIVDALDADGDNQPDDLNDNGSFTDEVAGLENPAAYPPGNTFWRVGITHFTPWDWNWPFALPEDAIRPNSIGLPSVDQTKSVPKDCEEHISSFVEERNRIFHEDIAIPGTDMTLHYAGNRVKGYKQIITVPASGDVVPDSLKRIVVKLEMTGRVLEQVLPAQPDQVAEFVWDGQDYLGRPLGGRITAHCKIGFIYDGLFRRPGNFTRAFAQGGGGITANLTAQKITIWRSSDIPIDVASLPGALAEGWTISAHHFINPLNRSPLFKGDGSINNNVNTITIDTLDARFEWFPDFFDNFREMSLRLVDASGNVYAALWQRGLVKIDTDGNATRVMGFLSEDGMPAKEIQLNGWSLLAKDRFGNLYYSDGDDIIHKLDTEGIITRIAGNGIRGYSGDGGSATEAMINDPSWMTVDGSGNLYFTGSYGWRIRKVDTGGIITTVAGNGTRGYSEDGSIANQVMIGGFGHVAGGIGQFAVDASGNLFFPEQSYASDGNKFNYIRMVNNEGVLSTIAGPGFQEAGNEIQNGEGGPATEAWLFYPSGVTVDASGNLYIAQTFPMRNAPFLSTIRKVDPSGIITTIAGPGTLFSGGDGGLATNANIRPTYMAVDASGGFYFTDQLSHSIRILKSPATIGSPSNIFGKYCTEENGLGHIMYSNGRHKKTVELISGTLIREFLYDDSQKLSAIRDRFGNEITIQRNGNGTPTAIVSAGGLITTLQIDANKHLKKVIYPDGGTYSFSYSPEGLMLTETEPEGNQYEHLFDDTGRVTDVFDQEGGYWKFTRNIGGDGKITSRVSTAEGLVTTYEDHETGGGYESKITNSNGGLTRYTRTTSGLKVNKTLSCGNELSFEHGIDPEYKYKVIKEMTETSGSLTRSTTRDISYVDTDADGIKDRKTETTNINGKSTIVVTSALDAMRTVTSPEGRTVTYAYDAETFLPSKTSVGGFNDTIYGYDNRGRLTSLSSNTRETSFTYDVHGFLASLTDPENHTYGFTHDANGRVTGITRPGGTAIGFDYDANGNITMLNHPPGIDHSFGYNKVNLQNNYQAPISGSYSYLYDRDRRLVGTTLPSGKQIRNIYDNNRLTRIQTPEGDIDISYLCTSKPDSITNGIDTITYGYDGTFVTSETLSGALNHTLSYEYNNDFRPISFSYGGKTFNYSYDNDGLLTGSGRFAIGRNAGNGLGETVTDTVFELSRTFNGYGELDTQSFTVNGETPLSWSLTRNDNGRITNRSETVDGTTEYYDYTYDAAGRLLAVEKDGSVVESYQYDAAGTRISEINTLRGIERNMTYSDEAHLLTAGSAVYQYEFDGFLLSRTDGTDRTEHTYSLRGELLQVKLPDGRTLDYVYDPLQRRIAKKIDGIVVEKYLWQGLTRLLAVYDGSDNIIMDFEYADARMPFSMTQEGATYYLTYDQIGSLRIITDDSGTIVKQIDYDSFGNILSESGSLSAIVPLGFAGGLLDRDTGLVKFGYRDYDPDTGRWTAKDPILFAGGDTDLYGYVQNDPINLVDPEGLWAAQIIGAALGGGINAYNNYTAYKSGQMSGADYSKSIVFGAGAGLLSSFGGPLAGALLSSLNNVHEQVLRRNTSPCHEDINWGETGRSFATGFAVGNISKGAYKAGNLFVRMPNVIGSNIGSKALQINSYGPVSGITANVAGTILTN